MLRMAMLKRFYNRYHPKLAYKHKGSRVGQKKDFVFSYLIDIQAMFHLALSNGRLLQRIIFPFDDVTREEKEKHNNVVKGHLWEIITGFVERMAFHKMSADEPAQNNENRNDVPQPAKKNML
jgi:hypothetical protein